MKISLEYKRHNTDIHYQSIPFTVIEQHHHRTKRSVHHSVKLEHWSHWLMTWRGYHPCNLSYKTGNWRTCLQKLKSMRKEGEHHHDGISRAFASPGCLRRRNSDHHTNIQTATTDQQITKYCDMSTHSEIPQSPKPRTTNQNSVTINHYNPQMLPTRRLPNRHWISSPELAHH